MADEGGDRKTDKLFELEDRVETLEIKNVKLERDLQELTSKFQQFLSSKSTENDKDKEKGHQDDDLAKSQLMICNGGLKEMDLFSNEGIINKYEMTFDLPEPSTIIDDGNETPSRELDEEFYSFSETDNDDEKEKIDLDGIINGFIIEEEDQIKNDKNGELAGKVDEIDEEKGPSLFENEGRSSADDSDLTELISEKNYHQKSSSQATFKDNGNKEKVVNVEIPEPTGPDKKVSRNNKRRRSTSEKPPGKVEKILKTTDNDAIKNKSISSSINKSKAKAQNTCPECGKSFNRPSNLVEHIRIHKNERPLECTICKKAFRQSNALKKHLLFHQKLQKCSNCDKICKTHDELVEHIWKDHPDTVPFKCSICLKRFTSSKNLRRHHQEIHSGFKFECPICRKNLTRKDNLDLHLKNVHYQQKIKQETTSGNSGKTSNLDKNDVKDTTGEDSKMIYQDQDKKNDQDTSDESSIEEEQEDSLSFSCPVCQERFPDRKSLSKHSQIHIKIKFNCKFCTKSFTEKSKIEKHIAKHKKEKVEAQKAESIRKKIQQIPAKLSYNSKVEEDHEPAKIFYCPICPSTFCRKKELKKHSRIHNEMFV